MTKAGNSQITRTITLLITIFSLSLPAYAKYSGGTGEPNDPYQIATAEDLMLLGESPEDYDKHFIMIADIDLDPNLPGRKIFDRAVIAPDLNDDKDWHQGTAFTGVFDGNGHTISHLTIEGGGFLGLFGQIGLSGRLESGATVSNLGLEAVDVSGMGEHVGGLVGVNYDGSITNSYSNGTVTGGEYVGGLVGSSRRGGSITASYSIGAVTGDKYVGGLVGCNGLKVMFQASLEVPPSRVASCFSNSTVTGVEYVGGLVGVNYDTGSITNSYSTGAVSGDDNVGGLVGGGDSSLFMVHGGDSALVTHCAWDIETSGQSASAAGAGLTTGEMMDPYMLGLNGFANDPNWVLDAGHDYPRLAWEGTPGQNIPEPEIDWLGGQGTAEIPYRIDTADQLIFLGQAASALWDKDFVLAADIDLNPNLPGRKVFSRAVFPAFSGVFDGNNHTISHLTISGDSYLGLFGQLGPGAIISNLVLEAADIKGTGSHVGNLAGRNRGSITDCFSSALVSGNQLVGGLVGENYGEGSITSSYSTCAVTGDKYVGGLVGQNGYWGMAGWPPFGVGPKPLPSRVADCFSNSTVKGGEYVGGLVGMNYDVGGNITNSYSTGQVSGDDNVGGLVGRNTRGSSITTSYSTGTVSGNDNVGGLVGFNSGSITSSFWDIVTSGLSKSAGGVGLTTAEMHTAATFLDAGWDFVDEIENGIDNIWYMKEGQDYPRLWWEEPTTGYGGGSGEPNDPYMIGTAEELISLGRCRRDYRKHFILTDDIDLNPNLPGREFFVEVAIAPQGTSFTGIFDGNGHTISNLPVVLFGSLGSGAEVRDLGLVDVNISLGKSVGGLSKDNGGIITNCYSTGTISGDELVGGLVGDNHGIITNSYSTSTVSGNQNVGGLVGFNFGGNVINSYSAGSVESNDINDFKVQHLYVLTRSGILEVSLAGGQRITVHGHYDSHALKIKDDILYVTEKARGGDIVAYDLEGHYLRTIPTPPQANSYLTFVVLPDDKFALLDNSNDKVFFIDYEGNLIATTSIKPVRDSHLQNLDGIVVDNRLILSEDGDGRVLEIDLASYEMSIFKDLSYLPHWLGAITYADGTYYICSPKIVYAFTESGSAVQVAEIQEYNITGIVVIEDYAYISVNFADKVYKIDLSSGETSVLVSGINYPGDIAVSSADRHIGGFIGYNCYGDVINCFWDIETSGLDTSAGGAGKTTAEMQTASTFLEAGWDFVGETTNGIEDIWWILEGQDYPRLWWEIGDEASP